MTDIFNFQEVQNLLERYKTRERDFSEMTYRYLDNIPLSRKHRLLAENLTISRQAPVPILSNYYVRRAWQKAIGNAVLSHWGDIACQEPGRLLHITITDQSRSTGTIKTRINLSRIERDIRNLFSYYNPTHLTVMEVKAYDNVYAANPEHGRCLFPHSHSICLIDEKSRFADLSIQEIKQCLGKRFQRPMHKDEYGQAEAMVVKSIGPSLEDLATVAVYSGKRPEIDVLRNDMRGKIFTYGSKGRKNQILKLNEITSLLTARQAVFAGGQASQIRTSAVQNMMNELGGAYDWTQHDLKQKKVREFWNQIRQLDQHYRDHTLKLL